MGRAASVSMVTQQCPICEKPFSYKGYGGRKRTTCSRECKHKFLAKITKRFGGIAAKYRSEYRAYWNMLGRCHGGPKRFPNHWHRYGGRGIVVCERWRTGGFAAFLEDMGPKPSPELTIERIDNDGNYEPSNCKWATRAEQYANSTHWEGLRHSVGGESLLISEIAARAGMSAGALGFWRSQGFTFEQLMVIGTPSKFDVTLKEMWPYPDDKWERYRLIVMWRRLDIPLRVIGDLLGMTRERVRQIEAWDPSKLPRDNVGRPRGQKNKPKAYKFSEEDLLALGGA